MIKAAIFDVDGTLVDSVHLHAECWVRALAQFGYQAEFAQVVHLIGKPGSAVIDAFIAPDVSAERRQALERFRTELFHRDYMSKVRPFRGVPDLFRLIRRCGQKIGLASSCKANELEHYKRIAGISDLVDTGTTSDDVRRSKPAPDVMYACVADLTGVTPAETLVVGDSRYDMEAAVRAGMFAVGLLCGSGSEEELRAAGALAVFRDPKDLQAHYERLIDNVGPKSMPTAGPHARRGLTNPDATPGAGTLPPVDSEPENMQPTS
jgi:phosphoglycolate phosphatase-like HAD superfamily hydrolase